jgi:ribose transport system ATP-binding protein
MTSAIVVRNVSKAFGATAALRDVSLDVAQGTVHGLLGGNGSGKSTLIKILAGVYQADGEGTVQVRGETTSAAHVTPAWSAAAGLRFVHQDAAVFPTMTVAENLSIGRGFEEGAAHRIRWHAVNARAAELIERFGISARPQQLLGTLPPAERMLVAIARALQDEDERSGGLVVLDEPTACLPAPEVDRLLDALRGYADSGHTIVLVSHRLGEILRVADAVTVLRDGALAARLERDELSEDRLIELIAGRPLAQDAGRPRRAVQAGDEQTPVLEVEGLASGRLHDISFSVRHGEIVGVAGLLGSGRSRLLRTLFGALPAERGAVRVEGRALALRHIGDATSAGVAYVPEDRMADGAFPEMSIRENLTSGRLGPYFRGLRLRHRLEGEHAAEAIERYLIRAASDRQPLASLSGGNQQKVILARWMRTNPRVLLLDEPTQGVDVHARQEIHSLMRQATEEGCGALVVSSDFEELEAICDRVLVLSRGRIVAELAGGDLTAAAVTDHSFRNLEVAP